MLQDMTGCLTKSYLFKAVIELLSRAICKAFFFKLYSLKDEQLSHSNQHWLLEKPNQIWVVLWIMHWNLKDSVGLHTPKSNEPVQYNYQLSTLAQFFFFQKYPLGVVIFSRCYFSPDPKLSIALMGSAHESANLHFFPVKQIASLIWFLFFFLASLWPLFMWSAFSELIIWIELEQMSKWSPFYAQKKAEVYSI